MEIIVDLTKMFSKQKSKEVGIATVKGSIPAAVATAILSGVSTYLGMDLSVDAMVAVFFGAGIGSVVGQFQKNPAEAIRRIKGMFARK
jgi:hypothetical protein